MSVTLNQGERVVSIAVLISLMLFGGVLSAAAPEAGTLGDVASGLSKSFTNLGLMISGASYLAGVAFAIGAIMKFKQHKDNPTQIPIGTPIALLFVGAALLFLPSLMKVAGTTMFGTSFEAAKPEGNEIGKKG